MKIPDSVERREELDELLTMYVRALEDRVWFCGKMAEKLGMPETLRRVTAEAAFEAECGFAELEEPAEALVGLVKLREMANAAEGIVLAEVWKARERLNEIAR